MPILEGYSVDVAVFFTRYSALNSADCPLQRDIAADHRTPTDRHAKPPIPRCSPIKLEDQQTATPDPNMVIQGDSDGHQSPSFLHRRPTLFLRVRRDYASAHTYEPLSHLLLSLSIRSPTHCPVRTACRAASRDRQSVSERERRAHRCEGSVHVAGHGGRRGGGASTRRMDEGEVRWRRRRRVPDQAVGAEALFERGHLTVDSQSRTHFAIIEPIEGGNLQTDVTIVSKPERTAFSTILSLQSDYGVAPLGLALRAPRFIRSVVGDRIWTVGINGERVFPFSFEVTAANLDELQALVGSQQRRLPMIIVSEYDARTLGGDIHELIAGDLCGLAHVVRLKPDGAWELTKRWGAEWSCYNGAVRLLWPMRGDRGDPRAHPLWTRDRLMSQTDDETVARDRLRHAIGRRILEASTYVPDDSAFADFAKLHERKLSDDARSAASGSPERSKEEYEEQISAQRAEIDRKDEEIRTLTDNVASLSMALRNTRPVDQASGDEQPVTIVAEPQSVAEAVATARRELAGLVDIAVETDADVADLNFEAGPPEKILRYLRTLGELANNLAEGSLGQSVPIWLRTRGVDCSGESDTSKNSEAGKRFRTRQVNGREVECEFHAKPSEGTSPDRCARIYFATSPTKPHVLVGYIGRHVD